MYRKALALLAVAFFVGACGSTPGERGVTGAGIGAGAGAVVGAVTGLTVLQGALIGAGVGGVTGAVTSPDTINLGKPIWKWGSGSAAARDKPLVRNIQSGLTKLGYNPGPVDGVMGQRTFLAIREYQQKNDLLVDGQPSKALEERILSESSRA